MARRNRTDSPNSVSTETTDPTPTEEAAVTTATTEAPVEQVADETAGDQPTESTVEAAAETTTPDATEAASDSKPKAEKKEIDISAFVAAVTTAHGERDTSTGDLAVAQIDPVLVAYRAVEGIAGKNKAKAYLVDKMKEAVGSGDIISARAYMVLQDSMSASSGGGSAPKTPADPTEAFVERKAGLQLALYFVDSTKVEGVSDDADDKVSTLYGEAFPQAEGYLAWLQNDAEDKGDEPEVPGFVKAACKLALGRSAKVGGRSSGGGSASGERRDIGEHIRQAFADQESGTFLTIAEIRKHKSTEYGDDLPSAGAISARLFPTNGKCTLEFVTPGTNEQSNRGATKN